MQRKNEIKQKNKTKQNKKNFFKKNMITIL